MLLLSHPCVLKVGRLVNGDLGYLQKVSHSSHPFVGGLDLAKFAKDRHVVPNAQCSLADLCALLLKKRLNKNVPECISQAWEDITLTEDQLNYAARDAYASLMIHQHLSTIDVPCRLPSHLAALVPVLFYNSDNTVVIAEGQISIHFNELRHDGINVTPTKTIIDILKVLVPGAIVSSHAKCALSSFGPAPFSVVALWSHLRTFNPITSFQTDIASQHNFLQMPKHNPLFILKNQNIEMIVQFPLGICLQVIYPSPSPLPQIFHSQQIQLVLPSEKKFLDRNKRHQMNQNLIRHSTAKFSKTRFMFLICFISQ